jgi:propionate catabolism operon transcriptional regulator
MALAEISSLPRICAIAQRDLRKLISDIAAEFADKASLYVLDKPLAQIVEATEEPIRRGEVDAILCAGAVAEVMQRSVDVPVVSVKVSGIDLLRALMKATETSSRILVINHRSTSLAISQFERLLAVQVAQQDYENYDDIDRVVQQAKHDGVQVIVGPSIAVQIAEKSGIRGVLLHSEESVRDAMKEAVTVARIRRAEDGRRRRLDGIFGHLREGLLAVDEKQTVEFINTAMADLLQVESDWAYGKPLEALASDIDVSEVARTGRADLDRIRNFGSKTVLLSRIPIRRGGINAGVVVTFHDAKDIQRADRNIRSRMRSRTFRTRYRLENIVGSSTAIRRAIDLASKYAASDSTILICGESGTGKEMLAQGIHAASRRGNHAFVAINCAALPESLLESELFGYEEGAFTGSRRGGKAGLVEMAHRGTLFLDEVGDMPLSLQTRLLRVLQEREVMRLGGGDPIPVDVRIVAATHRDLKAMKEAGHFREDLYYRLDILHLDVPPLRAHQDDVALLAEAFLRSKCEAMGLSAKTFEPELRNLIPLLRNYSWPGNIRELDNIVERIVLLLANPTKDAISNRLADVAPELFRQSQIQANAEIDRKKVAVRDERGAMVDLLRQFDGSRQRVAKSLGISRTTLWRRLRHLNIAQ